MSRIFSDEQLLTWEAYSSGGRFGLPDQPKIVFHCLSDPHRPPRFVEHSGDSVSAERVLSELPEDGLRDLLADSGELR
jgi:hypothetical protein